MKLGRLIRTSGLALALAAGVVGCDDDEGTSGTDGGSDAATDVKADTSVTPDAAKPDTVTTPDALDGGADGKADGGDASVDSSDGGDASVDSSDATTG